MNEFIRAFIAISVPAEIRERITAFQRELQQGFRQSFVRWTPVEQIHLTLRFLGNMPTEAIPGVETALRRVCTGIAGFELAAGGGGCFPDIRKPRVLWVGLSGALLALQDLQWKIANVTSGWGEVKERGFHPHLTIGRVKQAPPTALREISQRAETIACGDLGSWCVGEVLLMRSELTRAGAKHTELAKITLGG